MNGLFSPLQQLLREKDNTFSRTLGEGLTTAELLSLFSLSLAFYMGYGLLIGASYNWIQALVSAVKLPLLFLLTATICFPTLYLFLSYLGVKQGLRQLLGFTLLCLTYISVVLAAFAPVAFFFLITTRGYEFYKFINIVIFSIAGFIGIRLFYAKMNEVIAATWRSASTFNTSGGDITIATEGDNTSKARIFLFLWAVLFAVIGTQLSYTLSPFFGDPGKEFMIINTSGGSFFEDVIKTIANINRRR